MRSDSSNMERADRSAFRIDSGLTAGMIRGSAAGATLVVVSVPRPTIEDASDDLARLRRSLRDRRGLELVSSEYGAFRAMPGVLRDSESVVCDLIEECAEDGSRTARVRLIGIEPADNVAEGGAR